MKKEEKLLEKIGEISEDYIAEAAPGAQRESEHSWIKRTMLAACLVLVLFAGSRLIPGDPAGSGLGTNDLPMLAITEDTGGGMGFEGYMAYNITEIVNNNPWTEDMEIFSLPVYKNLLAYAENYQVPGADPAKMKEFLLDVAGRLGLKTDNLEITEKFAQARDSTPEGYVSPIALVVEDKNFQIEVNQQMTAEIRFKSAVSLPEGYNFDRYATYEELAAAGAYLKEEYKDLLGMAKPQINIFGGDYAASSGEDTETHTLQQGRRYNIEFYDSSGDSVEQIVNYNFNRAAFYSDGEGKLYMIRIFQPDLSARLGDYPVITAEEARKLLAKGNFITTVPEEFPGVEYAAKVELIYRTGGREKYFMPYYRFYVELPALESEKGLKTYGAYYVPAVESKYISNMPVWDGAFN